MICVTVSNVIVLMAMYVASGFVEGFVGALRHRSV